MLYNRRLVCQNMIPSQQRDIQSRLSPSGCNRVAEAASSRGRRHQVGGLAAPGEMARGRVSDALSTVVG